MQHENKTKQLPARIVLAGGAVVLAAILAAHGIYGQESAQNSPNAKSFRQVSDRSDPATRLFEEGRDSIQEEKWEEAARRFDRFIKNFPGSDKMPAALYWLAMSQERLEKLSEAQETVKALLKDYPASSWAKDARKMEIEIAGRLGDSPAVADGVDDSADEIKVVALQALFQSNPARALEFVNTVLMPGSKAGLHLKRAALNMMAQYGGKEGMAALRSVLTNENDPELRRAAAFWLGQQADDQTLELLKRVALQDKDPDVAKSALMGLSQAHNPRAVQMLAELAEANGSTEVRKTAIFALGQAEGEGAIDELVKIFDSKPDPEIGKQVIFALSQIQNARAAAKIAEIAKGGYDAEVREQAIFWLGQQGSADFLISLYDSEPDLEVKAHIIFSMSQSGKHEAVRKMIDIARNDKSIDLRKRAIFWLSQI
ncbi:MAG TPA: HEAT repeat domain-containing protein, partial [Blastocatellia bacterium]